MSGTEEVPARRVTSTPVPQEALAKAEAPRAAPSPVWHASSGQRLAKAARALASEDQQKPMDAPAKGGSADESVRDGKDKEASGYDNGLRAEAKLACSDAARRSLATGARSGLRSSRARAASAAGSASTGARAGSASSRTGATERSCST